LQHLGLKKWWQRYSPFAMIGLAGVSKHELHRARVVGRIFSYLNVVAAIALLCQWQLDLLHRLLPQQNLVFNFSIWCYFAVYLLSMLMVVNSKRRFIRQNWLLVLIVLSIVPFKLFPNICAEILSPLRPFLAIYIIVPTFSLIRDFLIDGQLRTTLLAALLIIIVFGLVVSGVDPGIKTPWDGLWWALSTISTVGYGDVVPTSALGRLLGTGLVVLGLGVFVVITANFLALFLRKNKRQNYEVTAEHLQLQQQLDDMHLRQEKIIKMLLDLKLSQENKPK
jgi:voltage-gated potassium channel